MDTVVATNSIVGTVNQSKFIPSAPNIIQQNGSSALAKSSTLKSYSICNEELIVSIASMKPILMY